MNLKINNLKKRLRKILERTSDHDFLYLVWCVHALQTGRVNRVPSSFVYDGRAATAEYVAEWSCHPWELETLILEMFKTDIDAHKAQGKFRLLNCNNFNAIREPLNLLREIENLQYAKFQRSEDIHFELERIGQRQFFWQKPEYYEPDFIRSAYLYGGETVSQYFLEKHGLSVSAFMRVGFAVWAMTRHQPFHSDLSVLVKVGSSSSDVKNARAMLVENGQGIRRLRRNNRSLFNEMAYRPSELRIFPCVGLSKTKFIAPLPRLIRDRVTTGLFYDVVGAPGEIRNAIAEKFERYAYEILGKYFPCASVYQEQAYDRRKGQRLLTPDVRLEKDGNTQLVVECKARRIRYETRFANRSELLKNSEFDELSKGIFQLWKYFAHLRLGKAPGAVASKNAIGMVLTLDTWASFNGEKLQVAFDNAKKAAESEPDISPVDQVPILVCNIQEFESSLHLADFDVFMQSSRFAASEDRERGLFQYCQKFMEDRVTLKELPVTEHLKGEFSWLDDLRREAAERRKP